MISASAVSAPNGRVGRSPANPEANAAGVPDLEERLRQSQDRFRRALQHSPIAVFNQDRNLRYTWVYATNPSSDARAMLGKTDEDLFPKEEASLLTRIKRRVLKTGKSAREEFRLTVGASTVFYDLVVNPLRDSFGRVVGLTWAAMDISQRKQAEAERAFLANIVGSSEDAIFVRQFDGTIITWNAGAERMFGYPSQEAVGRSASIMVPMDHLRELTRITEKVKHGERVEHYETTRLRKDGSSVCVSLTNSPMKDAAGNVIGISTIARDITKRKQLEAEILEINETVQRRVGQDLHDGLSQQLRGIAYLAHVLQETLAEKALPEAKDAARIKELLRNAICQTRDLARGLTPVQLESNGLMSALKELASSVEGIYGIACRFLCPEPVLISNCSTAIHLYRIAQEAIQNALKHGKPGRVTIDLTKTDHSIRLTVTDDGKGLSKTFTKSAGMGLKIMDYRAKSVGATLDLQPGRKGGTALSCVLPAERLNAGSDAR